ncbi:MAG: M1 family aminopeptidase [Bryobacteraceae bacterium]|nr:M1 family aminopeptidase [Bryobacteraceae bacterium]
MRPLALLFLAATALWCQQAGDGKAAAYSKALREAGLDPEACYRVRDLAFQKEDVRFYLTDGHIIFSKPVDGKRVAAMFTAEIPGGDAEVLVFPPLRSERMSLARFAKTPNLNEHFIAALFLFSDGSGEELLKQIEANVPRRLPEIGISMTSAFNETLRNFIGSYEIRLVQDRFTSQPERTGFFYAGISSKTLGAIDLLFDQRQRDQITVGQVVYRQDRRFFDTWTSFPARSFRTGKRNTLPSSVHLDEVRIDATLRGADLQMSAVTKMKFTARATGDYAIPFDIARSVKVTGAKVDGQPAEIFSRESLRANLLRATENEVFLVILPKPLTEGETHEIEFTHEGSVVRAAGNGVYFVASRLSWYPNRDAEFSRYETTFRYPKHLRLVSTGELADEKTEGDTRISHFVPSAPIRFAGFNLGEYVSEKTVREGVTLEVLANRTFENELANRRDIGPPIPSSMPRAGRRTGGDVLLQQVPSPLPSPAGRLEQMTSDIGGALEFMAHHFGPPPLKHLTVSPIPGTFGQGFPGLLYLSTMAYLNPSDRPATMQSESQKTFYSELLHAHETAHQWWGNLVTSASYQDDWLMEAMSNYSALLFLEKKKGRKAMDAVLEEYRQDLLRKMEGGEPIESAGPLIWGMRLSSSYGLAWRPIIYEKGTWVMHMLRERLGDTAFLKMFGDIARKKKYAALSTEDFQTIAASYLPPRSIDPKLESFFESWVYNTGIPTVKVHTTLQGKAPKLRLRGTVTQTDVAEDFSAVIPVDIQLPGRKSIRHWVQTSSETTSFNIDLTAAPLKVTTDPSAAVLSKR